MNKAREECVRFGELKDCLVSTQLIWVGWSCFQLLFYTNVFNLGDNFEP